MKTIRSWFTYEPNKTMPDMGESLAQPGKARTIQELMKLQSQGMQADIATHNTYFDEVDIEEIDKFFSPGLDLVDFDELKEKTDRLSKIVAAADEKREKERQAKDLEDLKVKQKREALLDKLEKDQKGKENAN